MLLRVPCERFSASPARISDVDAFADPVRGRCAKERSFLLTPSIAHRLIYAPIDIMSPMAATAFTI